MNSLNILSGGAAQGLVASVAAIFREQTGFDIAGEFGAVGAMADNLRGGTPTDIVILTAALVAKLAEEKLVVAATIADVGIGIPYFVASAMGYGAGQVRAVTYEYGNAFLIVAGLLNLLVVIDAYDVALGRK